MTKYATGGLIRGPGAGDQIPVFLSSGCDYTIPRSVAMSELPDAAVAEIAARMFDGDLSQQPQRVQDAVWRDARFALEAALKHIAPRVEVHVEHPIVLDGKRIDEALARRAKQGKG